MFEFLPTNSDNCGFLFCIEGTRRKNSNEKALIVKNRVDSNESQNTSNNDNTESICRKPTYAEIARRAVK